MPLKASAISLRSGNKWVLKDVSFEVAEGQVLGIFGPPASGKSAMLRVIACEVRGFTGSVVLIDGPAAPLDKRSVHVARPDRDQGWLSSLRGLAEARSAGEMALVAIEDAKASDAPLILFNEGFCHLDPAAKSQAFESLRNWAQTHKKSIVFASANFDDILQFCDNTAVLYKGELLQIGTPEEVYVEPSCSTVARITGRNNIFEARRLTSSKAEVPEFQSIEGDHKLTARRTEKAKLGALNQNVRLAIRPEHISISFGASFPEDNLLKARILSVRFLGANTLVGLDANGLKINALVMRLVGLKPGDECMLGMPPDRITVYPE